MAPNLSNPTYIQAHTPTHLFYFRHIGNASLDVSFRLSFHLIEPMVWNLSSFTLPVQAGLARNHTAASG